MGTFTQATVSVDAGTCTDMVDWVSRKIQMAILMDASAADSTAGVHRNADFAALFLNSSLDGLAPFACKLIKNWG